MLNLCVCVGGAPLPVDAGFWHFPAPKSPKHSAFLYPHAWSQPCGNLTFNSYFSWGPGKWGMSIIVLAKMYSEGGDCQRPGAELLAWCLVAVGTGLDCHLKYKTPHTYSRKCALKVWSATYAINISIDMGFLKVSFTSALLTKFLNLIHNGKYFGTKPIIHIHCIDVGDKAQGHTGKGLLYSSLQQTVRYGFALN